MPKRFLVCLELTVCYRGLPQLDFVVLALIPDRKS